MLLIFLTKILQKYLNNQLIRIKNKTKDYPLIKMCLCMITSTISDETLLIKMQLQSS